MLGPIKLANNNFLSSLDVSTEEVKHILELAKNFKSKEFNIEFKNKVLGLVFDKSSTRTRVSFQVAMSRLGGTTIDLTPEPAVVRVVKTGKTYTINLISNGVGYAVGDTTVIPGNQLDGATPTNDCTVRVTEVIDDSTNSIVAVEAT